MNDIVQRTGKFSKKEAMALSSKAKDILSLCFESPLLNDVCFGPKSHNCGLLHYADSVVKGLGPPLVKVREFESSPDLWVFDDASSGAVILLWSDGCKANPWKGTSYEVISTPDQLHRLAGAIKRLFIYIDRSESLLLQNLQPVIDSTRTPSRS